MQIRRTTEDDIEGIMELLVQVCNIHAAGRPDLFIPDTRKYTEDELKALLKDPMRPIFVAVNENRPSGSHELLGHAFCELQDLTHSPNMEQARELYLDDLCVNERCRGQHVGEALWEAVCAYAKEEGCYRVTLHVWSCNLKAEGFYEHLGLVPYMIGMEHIL